MPFVLSYDKNKFVDDIIVRGINTYHGFAVPLNILKLLKTQVSHVDYVGYKDIITNHIENDVSLVTKTCHEVLKTL